jgi:DNA-directed RNA polymerase subunit RPC12/RpoP
MGQGFGLPIPHDSLKPFVNCEYCSYYSEADRYVNMCAWCHICNFLLMYVFIVQYLVKLSKVCGHRLIYMEKGLGWIITLCSSYFGAPLI